MASFLSKFARGFTGQGAKLYADEAKEQMRAKLVARRDEVLAANRLKEDTAAQNLSDQKLDRAESFSRKSQEIRQADTLTAIEKRGEVEIEVAKAKPLKSVKATADKKIDRTKMASKALAVINQGQSMLVEGVEGYLTPDERQTKAISITDAFIAKLEGNPSIAQTPTITTQAQYDALPSGAEYIDSETGKVTRKR